MPQISSTYRILMAARDMIDALKHSHPDVPFATIGDDTITSLSTSSEIFTGKFKIPESTNIPPASQKNASNKRQDSEPQPVITSPNRHTHQPITETNGNQTFENVQQPPRVVTPAIRRVAPPRVPSRTHKLSLRSLS
jgi:hypothetical protein